MAPRCGQSHGDGPAASEKGVGAMWPVKIRSPLKDERRHRGSSSRDRQPMCLPHQKREMLADRDSRSARRNRLERPANVFGRGFGSHVSSWLGPPQRKIRMHDFARPNPLDPGSCRRSRHRRRPGNPSSVRPRAPTRSTARLDIRSRRKSRQAVERPDCGFAISRSLWG